MTYWNRPLETMPGAEMRARQLAHLRETVAWVHERVPFYRRKLDEAGITAADLRSLDDLRHLPLTVKDDLRDQYPFGLCAVPPRELVRVHASSGTTGKPITGPYTAGDLEHWTECMARTLVAHGIGPDDIVQNAYGLGLFTGGLGFFHGALAIGCCVVPTGSGMTERQVMLMQDFGATALFCTPSYALTIAEQAERMGVDVRKLPLRIGSFGAEPWSVEMRREIEERMGITAHEAYGLTEMMGPGVAFSCAARRLHVNEDHCYPEIVDPATLEPLPPGARGELVLTALRRRAMPLLRYRTRDITSLRRLACECGRTLVTMDKILGRSDDMLKISGVNVFPGQVETVVLELPELEPLFQMRVSKKGYLDALKVEAEARPEVYARGEAARVELGRRLAARMRAVTGLTVTVEILPPGAIPRSEGKARRVLDERPR